MITYSTDLLGCTFAESPAYLFTTARVPFADLDITELWSDFQLHRSDIMWNRRVAFGDLLRSLVVEIDHDEIDELEWCEDCSDLIPDGDSFTLANGNTVCEDCRNEYWMCEDCEELYPDTHTVNDREVCSSCLDDYRYCDECDEYYGEYDSDEHDHAEYDCPCEAPVMSFEIRNDGNDPLENDTRVTMALPAGVMSEGISAIRYYLNNEGWKVDDSADNGAGRRALLNAAQDVADMDPRWQTKEGNFTKRLSRMAYKVHGVKITPEQLSQVGNLGAQHSAGVEFALEITRDLNQPAGEFAHEDSCWFDTFGSGRPERAKTSRCALKGNGGFALRTFGDYGVSGRAWVLPMVQGDDGSLVPTHETMSPDAFLVFNGYEDLSGYVPARILAHMFGATYRKVSVESSMYVNNGVGYLVAREEIAQRYTDGYLSLWLDHC